MQLTLAAGFVPFSSLLNTVRVFKCAPGQVGPAGAVGWGPAGAAAEAGDLGVVMRGMLAAQVGAGVAVAPPGVLVARRGRSVGRECPPPTGPGSSGRRAPLPGG